MGIKGKGRGYPDRDCSGWEEIIMEPEKKLDHWAGQAFRLLGRSGSSAAGLAEDVAYTVGRRAAELGLSDEQLSRWMDGAFRAIWPAPVWPQELMVRRALLVGHGRDPAWGRLRRRHSLKGKNK